MNGFKLFGKEIQSIVKNKKILIPIIAILFVPLIYGGMFLWSFKDPYARMSELPVAVVNLDKGATLDGKEFQVGDNLIDNLKENDSFDFQFVSKKEAMDGLDDLTYYMVIEIPENFSKNATTLLDDSPQKLQIKFMPNDSYNFLASQIGETAVEKIKTSVAAEVSKTYAETIFSSAMEMSDGFQSASKGTEKLNNGAIDLNNGANELKDNLQLLAEKSIEFKEGIQTAENGTKEIADGTGELSSGIGQLSDASSKLYTASQTVQDGTTALASGLNEAGSGIAEMNEKLPTLVNGTNSLIAGFNQLQAQLADQLAAGITNNLTGENSTLMTGINKLNTEINTGLKGLGDPLSKQLASGAAEGLSKQIANQMATTQAQQTEQLKQVLTAQLGPDKANQIVSAIAQNPSSPSQEEMQKSLQNTIYNSLQPSFAQGINQGVNEATKSIDKGFDQLESGIRQQLTQANLSKQISSAIQAPLGKLSSGLQQVQQGQVSLQTGVKQLAQGTQSLQNGANQLSAGQQKYVANFGVFTQKLSEAQAGANQLATGASQLNSGMGQLVDGSNQLTEGTGKLADGSVQLADGTKTLQAGTDELNKKLGEAADESSSLKANDKTYDMMASPVELHTKHVNRVPNYGTGFAPYFISLGLFVGALLLTIVFPLVDSAGIPKNGWSWFTSKLGFMASIGIIQAIFVATLVLYGLDVEVQNVPLFYLFTILTSLTFITLIQFLATIGGNPGRFIGILILILQLTSSAGTFPLEVIPKQVQFFNPLLPMTYSVKGFKAVISSGDYSFMWQNAGILLIYIVGSMLISLGYFMWKFNQIYKNDPTEHNPDVAV